MSLNLPKSFVTQHQFAMVVMAAALGSDEGHVRMNAGNYVASVFEMGPKYLHRKFKKDDMGQAAKELIAGMSAWPVEAREAE